MMISLTMMMITDYNAVAAVAVVVGLRVVLVVAAANVTGDVAATSVADDVLFSWKL